MFPLSSVNIYANNGIENSSTIGGNVTPARVKVKVKHFFSTSAH